MPTTLKDVALRAGVSIKTVSNVVNGNAHVTEEMRERVLVALKELNYQPNLPARYLRKGRVGVLALAIPDLSNPYFSEIGNAVIAAAATRSYTILLDHTGGERKNEQLVINGVRPHLIDGIILSPLALELEDFLSTQVTLPIVLLGERVFAAHCDHIAIDNVQAAIIATNHLIAMGRKRIAAIGVQERHSGVTAHLRLQGYKQALLAAGLPFDPQLIVQAPSYHRSNGAAAAHYLLGLDEPPDAIFCFNDLLALGAMRVLHEKGCRIPTDIALIGFDDIEEASYVYPSLTTIAPDKDEIGETAVSFLLERINGLRTNPPERIEVPFRLIVRESTTGCQLPPS